MWGLILNFLGGPIIKGLLDAYNARLKAQGEHEVVASNLTAKALELDTREAEINSRVVIAEQANWFTRSIRPLFALPFVMFTWKVVIWDKMLQSWTGGSTDALDPKMWGVFMAIVIAYFGGRSAEKVANTVAEAFRRR